MRALVTGGAGFIGSHLCELLVAKGVDVTIVDNLNGGRVRNIEPVMNKPGTQFFEVDIRDSEALKVCFQADIDWVFHLAGLADIVPSIEMPQDYYSTNVSGTFNVLECARSAQVKRLIYAASSSCYGIPDRYPTPESAAIKPEYPYALTKNLGEQLVMHWEKVYRLPSVSLRLFNVYGPRVRTNGTYGAVFGVFLAQKANNKPLTVVGDGTQSRDFTYVTDVAEAFYCAAASGISGEILNVGSGGHYSVNKLVSLIGGDIVYVPKRPGEPDCTFADISKINHLLGWQATVSFEQGVANMLADLQHWQDAPLWDAQSIASATGTWFRYLGKDAAVETKPSKTGSGR